MQCWSAWMHWGAAQGTQTSVDVGDCSGDWLTEVAIGSDRECSQLAIARENERVMASSDGSAGWRCWRPPRIFFYEWLCPRCIIWPRLSAAMLSLARWGRHYLFLNIHSTCSCLHRSENSRYFFLAGIRWKLMEHTYTYVRDVHTSPTVSSCTAFTLSTLVMT